MRPLRPESKSMHFSQLRQQTVAALGLTVDPSSCGGGEGAQLVQKRREVVESIQLSEEQTKPAEIHDVLSQLCHNQNPLKISKNDKRVLSGVLCATIHPEWIPLP